MTGSTTGEVAAGSAVCGATTSSANDVAGTRRVPGEASPDLVPSDIWGAALRWCDDSEDAPQVARSQPRPFPLKVAEALHPDQSPSSDQIRWQRLRVELDGGPAPDDVRVLTTLSAGDAQGSTLTLTDGSTPLVRRDPATGAQGLMDLLAEVPRELPTVGWAGDEHRYAVLLIPGWQIDEALGRLARGDAATPLPSPGAQVRDGVGWVLEHPQILHVQVEPPDAAAPVAGEPELAQVARWPDLMEPGGGLPSGLRAWGFPAGLLSGREPIALLGARGPSWGQVAAAQRAAHHSLFVGSTAIVLLLSVWGMRRRRDLWSPVPEERVDYWPGVGDEAAAPAATPGLPASPVGGGR
jgi:hypothetical protein